MTILFKKMLFICSALAVLTVVFTGCQSTKTHEVETTTETSTRYDTEKSIQN